MSNNKNEGYLSLASIALAFSLSNAPIQVGSKTNAIIDAALDCEPERIELASTKLLNEATWISGIPFRDRATKRIEGARGLVNCSDPTTKSALDKTLNKLRSR